MLYEIANERERENEREGDTQRDRMIHWEPQRYWERERERYRCELPFIKYVNIYLNEVGVSILQANMAVCVYYIVCVRL